MNALRLMAEILEHASALSDVNNGYSSQASGMPGLTGRFGRGLRASRI
jgi:hypothetical protein